MSTQEKDRKHIAMLIVVAVILTYMCGCKRASRAEAIAMEGQECIYFGEPVKIEGCYRDMSHCFAYSKRFEQFSMDMRDVTDCKVTRK